MSKNVKLAIVLYAFIGAVLGTAYAYLAFSAGAGADGARSFARWIERDFFDLRDQEFWWLIAGAVLGAVWAYARYLLSKPE